jgi:hypothetical protein
VAEVVREAEAPARLGHTTEHGNSERHSEGRTVGATVEEAAREAVRAGGTCAGGGSPSSPTRCCADGVWLSDLERLRC